MDFSDEHITLINLYKLGQLGTSCTIGSDECRLQNGIEKNHIDK